VSCEAPVSACSAPPRLRVSRSDAHRDAEHAEGWCTRRLLSMAGTTLPTRPIFVRTAINQRRQRPQTHRFVCPLFLRRPCTPVTALRTGLPFCLQRATRTFHVLACTASIYPRWHISRPEALPYCIEALRSSAACSAGALSTVSPADGYKSGALSLTTTQMICFTYKGCSTPARYWCSAGSIQP